MTLPRLAGLLATFAIAIVAGCSLTRPSPVKNTFLLDPPNPPAAAAPKPATLRIGTFNVSAAYRDRAFTYRTGDVKFESDFYNEFFVAPGPMVGQATTRALAAANVFTRVVPAGTAPEEGDFVLEGFVSDLYADTRDKPAAAAASPVDLRCRPLSNSRFCSACPRLPGAPSICTSTAPNMP